MALIQFVGIAASICSAVSMLPQIIKILKDKKAENISYGMSAVILTGVALWIWYGIMKNDMIISISNGVSFIVNIVLAYLSFKYSQRQ